jgi:NRPS condensation-like uncharacterized protein
MSTELRIPFNVVDESFAQLDNALTPPTVQLEVRLGGRVDLDRLWNAIHAALRVHPLAAARRAPWTGADAGFEWIVADDLQVEPLALRRCRDDELASISAELQGAPIPIDVSPAMRFLLARTPDSDLLLAAAHHAASDGIGTLRLMTSIARAYAGRPDPTPDIDPVTAHTITAEKGTSWELGSPPDPAAEVERLARTALPPTRVAAEGGVDRPGYAMVFRRVPVEPLVKAPVRALAGATVNDLLLAALHLAIERWNAEHGQRSGLIAVQMPMNARPSDRSKEVVANLVFAERITTIESERADRPSTVAALSEQTRRTKQRGPFVSVPSWNLSSVPTTIWWRWAVASALPFNSARLADTAVLSNLGRFDPGDLSFGEDLPVTELWFSPPAGGPTGVNLGAVTLGDELFLVFRYTHPQFDHDAAARFAATVLAELDALCHSGP